VDWRDSLQPFLGVHFSNELLDAMPVRLIRSNMEKLVDLKDDKFVFVERPISQQATFQRRHNGTLSIKRRSIGSMA